jgi:hypothetical protein
MTAHAMRVSVAMLPNLYFQNMRPESEAARAQRESSLHTPLTLIDSPVVCLCDFALRRTG